MRAQNGFTLVEILVVIAIIALMSSILYGTFDSARQQTRTKALQTELKEMQLALEVYKAQYDRYPPVGTAAASCHDVSGNPHTSENSNGTCRNYNYLATNFVPEFMSEIPESRDSNNPNCSIEYQVEPTGAWYKLTAVRCFEGAGDASEGIGEDEEFSRCPSSCANCGGVSYDETQPAFYESLSIYSFGGECR